MNEQISIKPQHIFNKYNNVDIAAMCAKKGFTLEQAKLVQKYWSLLEAAHQNYMMWETFKDSAFGEAWHEKSLDSMDEAYKSLDDMQFMNWTGSGDVSKGVAYMLATNLIAELSVPALTPEPASENIFEQFRDTDIAYAASLMKLDYQEALVVWNDIIADQQEETTRNSRHSLASLLDMNPHHINVKDGDETGIAIYFLRYIGLLAA